MSKNRDKFVELAEKRVTRALKDIRLIGNLSNKTKGIQIKVLNMNNSCICIKIIKI